MKGKMVNKKLIIMMYNSLFMTIITQNTTKGQNFEATREGIKVVATIYIYRGAS
jgi:hypothetical protein